MFQYPTTQNFNPYQIGQQGLYDSIKLPQQTMSNVNPYPSVFQSTNSANITPNGGSNAGSNSLFDWIGNNPGTSLMGLGYATQGLGNLYGTLTMADYFKDASSALDKQQGLYENEIARRNQTRESYGSAFSDAQGY